jgi:peptidyl-prolyl cis-trans isomerase A (cyclophilin A)
MTSWVTGTLIAVFALVVAAGGVYVFRPFPETGPEEPAAVSTETPVDNTVPWPSVTDASGKPLPFTPLREVVRVTLRTNLGDIGLVLDGARAPLTVGNFVHLAENNFYDNTTFHRVIPDFMIQGGDPISKDSAQRERHGTGGPAYSFADEINAASYGLDRQKLSEAVAPEQVQQIPVEAQNMTVQQFYEAQGYRYTTAVESLPLRRGVLAMANSGPNTNGSQFFIITAAAGVPHLNGKHTAFGVVESGMDVVDAISNVERDERDNPVTAVVVQDVLVSRGGLPGGLQTQP